MSALPGGNSPDNGAPTNPGRSATQKLVAPRVQGYEGLQNLKKPFAIGTPLSKKEGAKGRSTSFSKKFAGKSILPQSRG